ncbi:MAG: hypothetical protein IJS01_08880 [Lentisphaeria bacterium]|nr:hypothetical protein [Lentisphaeria bacterium]
MKRFLLLLCFAASLLRGAEMGRLDPVSGNFLVTTDHWHCSFLQGSLFPGEFVFSDGTAPGSFIFDPAATDGKGRTFFLRQERWAETKILRNDENACVIERSGCFWRNVSPLISRLDGVEAVCRYEFARKSPGIVMKFTFRKKADISCTVNRCFALSWYFEQPFGAIAARGGREPFVLGGKKPPRTWDVPGEIVLESPAFRVTLKSKRVIASLRRKGAVFPCSLDGGLWQFRWEKGETLLEREAVLVVEKTR